MEKINVINSLNSVVSDIEKRVKSKFQSSEKTLTLKRLIEPSSHQAKSESPFNCIGISGFSTQGTNLVNTWKPLQDIFSNADLYALEWEAGNSLQIGFALSTAIANRKLLSLLPASAKYSKVGQNRGANPLGIADRLVNNPIVDFGEKTLHKSWENLMSTWEGARENADKAGESLAKEIKFGSLSTKPLVLIGINLGTEVIFSALRSLGHDSHESKVVSVIFLGSTISCNKEMLSEALKTVSGEFFNVYSTQDIFLKSLALASNKSFLGLHEITNFTGISNCNLEQANHFQYASKMNDILLHQKIASAIYKQIIDLKRHSG